MYLERVSESVRVQQLMHALVLGRVHHPATAAGKRGKTDAGKANVLLQESERSAVSVIAKSPLMPTTHLATADTRCSACRNTDTDSHMNTLTYVFSISLTRASSVCVCLQHLPSNVRRTHSQYLLACLPCSADVVQLQERARSRCRSFTSHLTYSLTPAPVPGADKGSV